MLDSIYERLSKIQDKRDARGKRYKLCSILSLILLGYMQGCKSLAGVYRFGKTLNKSEKKKLGFTQSTPSHPTITETLKLVDSAELSKALEDIILQDDNIRHLAIDGKSIRSTHSNKNGMLHLVSLYSVDTCGVLGQIKSALAGGEIVSAKTLIKEKDISGKVITGDAMFAQRELCDMILQEKGDYVFKVKRNRKHLYDSIYQEFEYYKSHSKPIECFETGAEKGHGRIEQRKIEVINIGSAFFANMKINRIGRITKYVYNLKTCKESEDVTYIISSIKKDDATPQKLLEYTRKHWMIENKLHRTRDYSFAEDVCNIASLKSQFNNATVKNIAIFLLNKINNSITYACEAVADNLKIAFKLFFATI